MVKTEIGRNVCRETKQKIGRKKYPIPKNSIFIFKIPNDSENILGRVRVLPKIIGSGRVSGTRQALPTERSWRVDLKLH